MMSRPTRDNEDKPDATQSLSTSSKRGVAIIDNRIDSKDVFVGTREIMIVHGDDNYRLRLTSQNKLILTK